MREAHSVDHFEWEPTAGVSLPGAYGGTDFDNRGDKGSASHPNNEETTNRFLYVNGGLWGQVGGLGVTLTGDALSYAVASQTPGQASINVDIARFNAVAAYGFLNNQLCVGAGVRMAYLTIAERGSSANVISMFGVSPQIGLIVKPEQTQFRVGLTVRAPVSAASHFGLTSLIQETPDNGPTTTIRKVGTTNFIAPTKVVQPWEIELGIAYQLGPRPLNPRWIEPKEHELELERDIAIARQERLRNIQEVLNSLPNATPLDREERARRFAEMTREETAARELEDEELKDADARLGSEREARYLNWPRERVLLLASVLMSGADDNAVALEGFINQQKELVGQRVTLMPRFGIESEAVPNLLKTRAGIYIEPSRFSDGSAREHFTVGLDVRLFQWDVFGLFPHHQWSASAFLDMSDRYQNFGIGAGTWH